MEPTTPISLTAPVGDVAAGQRLFMLMRVEWGLALLATVAFAFALYYDPSTGLAAGQGQGVVSMSVAAAIAFMGSFFAFPIMLRRTIKSVKFPISTAQALRVSFTPYSIRLVFCELIAVVGFIGAHGNGINFYLPFWAWSVLSLAIASPTEQKFMTALYDSRPADSER